MNSCKPLKMPAGAEPKEPELFTSNWCFVDLFQTQGSI